MSGPWDSGLQNERTGLAWQRTALAVLTGSLLMARLVAEVSVILAVVTGLVALTCTTGLGWIGLRRYRQHDTALWADLPVGGALPHLLLTALVALTALAALVYVTVL